MGTTTKTEQPTKAYKWINNGSGRVKWTLEYYHVYPELGPIGTPCRGPYYLGWLDVHAADKAKRQNELDESGAKPLELFL